MIDFLQLEACFLQAIPNRLRRESRCVFHSIEALFLHSGNEPAVAHDGRRRVPVVRIDAQNIHAEASYSKAGSCHGCFSL